ncbi:MAG: hypothetical protein AB7U98_10450 [Candidatus Nitrosocosmicus sp.]
MNQGPEKTKMTIMKGQGQPGTESVDLFITFGCKNSLTNSYPLNESFLVDMVCSGKPIFIKIIIDGLQSDTIEFLQDRLKEYYNLTKCRYPLTLNHHTVGNTICGKLIDTGGVYYYLCFVA